MVSVILISTRRSSSQANMATSCSAHIPQNPKTKLPSIVQTIADVNVLAIRAEHMSWVDVKAPMRETAIDAATSLAFHSGWISRRGGIMDVALPMAPKGKLVIAREVSSQVACCSSVSPDASINKRRAIQEFARVGMAVAKVVSVSEDQCETNIISPIDSKG